MLSPVEAREAVHLIVLQSLAKLNIDSYALKGGVNLRFFFGSIRYSEDLDLDADSSVSDAVRDLITGVFNDRAVARRLRELGIRGLDPGEGPNKDSSTTFRFKFGIIMPGDVRHPTKIEVSYRSRSPGDEILIDPVLPAIAEAYMADPSIFIVFPHYSRTSAIRQKVVALARRTLVQARDIFDLYFLMGRLDEIHSSQLSESISSEDIRQAHDRTLEIPYREYLGQVVEFLSPGDRSTYEGEEVWDTMRLSVVDFIETLDVALGEDS